MSAAQTKTRRRSPLRWVFLLVLVLAAAVGARTITSGDAEQVGDEATFRVSRGPLTISVLEAGTIRSAEQEIIKSEVEGNAVIIYLIPEGTEVKKGDLLVELEASQLEDELVEQQIRTQNAEATFISARENLEVVKNQSKSDISKAELDYRFAQEDLTKYLEGEYPQQVKEADSRITLAAEELENSEETLAWSQKLFDDKYISQSELDRDRLSFNRAKLDHELAVAAKDLLVEYTHERQLDQLKSDIEQMQLALERVKLRTSADIVQAEADLEAKDAEYKQQVGKLKKVEDQITKTRIFAPQDGLVVYATSAKASWRGNDDPLDEGQAVRERQELIYLPKRDEMIAEIHIHESNLEKVQPGLPVEVKVDALPNKSYKGTLLKIAPFPNAYQMRLNPDLKVYMTQVKLDGKHAELRTGMSCEAEVLIDELNDALFVPIQAVVEQGGQHFAYLKGPDGPQRTPVEIGLDNNSMVHVKDGLADGQEVLLAPPLRSTPAANDAELVAKHEERRKRTHGGSGSKNADAKQDESTGEPKQTASAPSGEPAAKEAKRGDDRGDPREGRPGPEMTEAQRAAMRERFEKMSPEEREAAIKKFRERASRGG